MLFDPIYFKTVNLVGVNHRTLAVADRELLSKLGDSQSSSLLTALKESCNIEEAAVISTCNRFEVVSIAALDLESSLHGFIRKALPNSVAAESIYSLKNSGAVKHLFEVAASLDSMVLGENQILKQVRDSYQSAVSSGFAGKYLHHLFQDAFRVAKRVRSDTGIAKHGISVSYIAVRLAEQIFGDLNNRSVLILGSGEMAELAAVHFKARGIGKIVVANRTLLNAVDVARLVGGSAASLDELPELLKDVDIVIGSVAVESPIITTDLLKRVRPKGDLFCIDLGVPRNFAEEISKIEGLYLYNIDDLDAVAKQNIELRKEALCDASLIVQHGILRFEKWLMRVAEEPKILDLRGRVGQLCAEEISALFSNTLNSDELKEKRELLTQRLARRLAHEFGELIEGKALAELLKEEE